MIARAIWIAVHQLRRAVWIVRGPLLIAIGATAVAAVALVAASGALASGPARPPTPATTVPAAPSPPEPTASYTFLITDPVTGQPVRFDPCARSIAVEYNPVNARYPAETDVQEATNRLAQAMGRPVAYIGTTNISFTEFERHPPTTPTIFVDWIPSASQLSSPMPDLVGQAAPFAEGDRIVFSHVTLVSGADLAPGFGPSSFGADLLHEFGHAVDAGHVTAQSEQMYPQLVPGRPAGYGPGDIAGLHVLAGTCHSK